MNPCWPFDHNGWGGGLMGVHPPTENSLVSLKTLIYYLSVIIISFLHLALYNYFRTRAPVDHLFEEAFLKWFIPRPHLFSSLIMVIMLICFCATWKHYLIARYFIVSLLPFHFLPPVLLVNKIGIQMLFKCWSLGEHQGECSIHSGVMLSY